MACNAARALSPTLLQPLAQAAEPSAESIARLLAVSQNQKLMEGVLQQLDGMIRNGFEQAIDAQSLDPEQRRTAERAFRAFSLRIAPILAEDFSRERIHSMTEQTYRESFSQEEVDGLIGFHGSRLGRTLIEKMPAVMQKSISLMQRMPVLMQKVQAVAHESAEEFRAEQARATTGSN